MLNVGRVESEKLLNGMLVGTGSVMLIVCLLGLLGYNIQFMLLGTLLLFGLSYILLGLYLKDVSKKNNN